MQQKCCAATDSEFCSIINNYCKDLTGAAGGTYASHIMLKMILNNNIFQTFSESDDTSDQGSLKLKGIDLLQNGGSWMGSAAGNNCDSTGAITGQTTPYCQSFTKYQTYLNVLDVSKSYHLFYNHWSKNTADNGVTYYELFWACTTVLPLKNICGAVDESYTENVNVPVVMLKKIKFSTDYAGFSLYPNQKEFDMLICFRYSKDQSAANGFNVSQQYLASSSLLNVGTINWQQTDSPKTQFSMGVFNYYNPHQNQGTNDLNYIVNLVRVQARFNTLDLSTAATKLALFFGADDMLSGGINPNGGLNISECVAVGSITALTCELKQIVVLESLKNDQLTLPKAMVENPLSMNHFDFKATGLVQLTTEINIYIPVVIGTSLIEYAMIGWLSDTNIIKLFKVFGRNEGTYNFVKSTKLGGTSLIDNALNKIDFAEGVDLNWKVKDNGCVTTAAGYSDATQIKPANTVDTAEIISTISACTSVMKLLNSVTGEANSHFIVHSFKKFWSGTISWGYQSASDYQSAVCAQLTIKTIRSTTTTPYTYYTAYMVVCPYEGSGSIPVSSVARLQLKTWAFPSNYGITANLGKHMHMIWTAEDGSVQAYSNKLGTSTQKLTACTLSQIASVVQNAQFQKTQFTVTPDLPIILTTSFPVFKVKLTVSQVYFNLAAQKCMINATGISCAVVNDANTLIFTMTNVGATTVTIDKNTAVQCSFWVKYTSSASTTTYSGEIHMIFDDTLRAETLTGTEVIVSQCSQDVAWNVGIAEAYSLTMTNPEFSLRAEARSPFSFTFTSNKAYLDIGFFVINLGFLGSQTNLASDNLANLRCGLYKDDLISHDFSTFSMTNLQKVEIQFKEVSVSTVTSLSALTYKFQCYGAKSITQAPGSTEKLSVIYRVSTVDVGTIISDDLSKAYTTLRTLNSAGTTITLKKEFSYVGLEANYIFNIKPQEGSTTTGVTLFEAGSKIVIEFPREISPKLNRLGKFDCLQESKQLICDIDFERRIIAVIACDLDPTNAYGHNITIVGVEQPSSFTSYSNIFVGLVPKDQAATKFEVIKDGGSLADTTLATFVTKVIPVLYFKQSANTLRSSFSFTMDIALSANSVKSDTPMYVDFPDEFQEAMFIGVTPLCSLKNVVYGSNTITEYALKCQFVNTRRIQITQLDDSGNTEEKRYQLIISNLQTPNYIISRPFVPTVWHGNSTNPQLPLYKTNLGDFNGSYLSFAYEDSKVLLAHDFQEKSFEAYVGVYKNSMKLFKNNAEKFFNQLDIIKVGADYSKFSYYPIQLLIPQASNSVSLKIAGAQSTTYGMYQIKFSHEQSNLYTQFPPVNVKVISDKCLLTTAAISYDIPDGGYSLPILIDFTTCIPISSVEVTGALTTDGIESKYFKFASSQNKKTFTFDEDNLQKYVAFKVSGARDTLSDDEPANPAGILSFTFGGANGASFTMTQTISLQIVDGTTEKPQLYLNDIKSDTPGQQAFEFICTKSGTIYFAFSQNETAISEITYAQMYPKTEGAGKTLTDIIDNVVYGFILATDSNNSTFSTIVKGLFESEAKYVIKSVAMDQMGLLSNYTTKNWTQVSNQGKPVMLGLLFQQSGSGTTNATSNASLTEVQSLNVACSLSKMLGLSKKIVFTQYGKSCYDKDSILQPSTQSTTTTNSSTLRDLSFWALLRSLESNFTSDYQYFIVLPDYYSSSSDQYSLVKTTTEDANFQSYLKTDSEINLDITGVQIVVNENFPVVPVMTEPTIKIVENEAQFTFSLSNTNGFVFLGVYGSKIIANVTDVQLKQQSGFNFSGYEQTFCFQEKSQTVAISSLPKGTYAYSYLATNENMNTLTYSTGVVKGTNTFTIVDTSTDFGFKLQLTFIWMIAILMIILQN